MNELSARLQKEIINANVAMIVELINTNQLDKDQFDDILDVVKDHSRYSAGDPDFEAVEEYCENAYGGEKRDLLHALGVDMDDIESMEQRIEELEGGDIVEIKTVHDEYKVDIFRKLHKAYTNPFELENALSYEAREKIRFM